MLKGLLICIVTAQGYESSHSRGVYLYKPLLDLRLNLIAGERGIIEMGEKRARQ